MNEYILPAGFFKGGKKEIPDAFLYAHRIQKSTAKNRVVLTEHLLTFITEGSKEIVTGDQRLRLDNNHFALVTAGNCLMSETVSKGSTYACKLVFFSNDILQAFLFSHRLRITRFIAGKKIRNKEVLRFNNDAFTETFKQSLAFVPQGSIELIKIKLQEILLYLLETQPDELCSLFAAIQNNNEDLLFKNIINSKIDSNLSIQELAFICNVSSSTFKRKFAKIFNDSPTNWIRKKRMEHAAFLLRYNKERPSDIYLRLGYENFSSFTQSFKNIYGKTPKEYQSASLS